MIRGEVKTGSAGEKEIAAASPLLDVAIGKG